MKSKISSKKVKRISLDLGLSTLGITDPFFDENLYKLLKKRSDNFGFTEFESGDLVLRSDPSHLLEGAESVIVFAFPYYSGEVEKKRSNLSIYCRMKDYHIIIDEFLDKFILELMNILKEDSKELKFKKFADTSNICDRYLAYKAGLGYYGINNTLINDRYGSYFFIGGLITNLELEYDEPLKKTCLMCMKCMENCPGGAIGKNYEFDSRKCVSYLTQKKELTDEEEKIVSRGKSAFGCDVCQRVCPHNRDIDEVAYEYFKEDILSYIGKEDIEELSNKKFKLKYGDRAFSWRGKKILQRNLKIIYNGNDGR